MPLKRKPHHANLDPTNPGVRVNPADLRTASAQFHRAQAQTLQAQGIQPGPLAGKGVPFEAPPPEQPPQRTAPPPQTPPTGNGKPPQQPEPPIPEIYQAPKATGAEKEEIHPLLAQLEEDFGLKKISVKYVKLGGYIWTFRPMSFQDYEWMAAKATETDAKGTEPSMSVANVAATLAAINGTPVYQIFDIDDTGRHIPDPLNPPPDIKYEAALYLIEWLRNKVGMWELVGKLDEQTDLLFEEERSVQYPLWETLASPYRRRIVELHQILSRSTKGEEEEGSNSGDEQSQSQESSLQTSEQLSFGTTSQLQTSSSTGTNESSETNLTP